MKHTTPAIADGTRLFYRADWKYQKGLVGGHYDGPLFIAPKNNSEKGLFRPTDPGNVLSQIRCYRYFFNEYLRVKRQDPDGNNFSGMVDKDEFMEDVFSDVLAERTSTNEAEEMSTGDLLGPRPSQYIPTEGINKTRVGRLLRMCVPYRLNFQRAPRKSNGWTNQQLWRWAHSLEIAYGLEHLMTVWLPRLIVADGGSCSTSEEYKEELQILREQGKKEDLELVQSVISRKIY